MTRRDKQMICSMFNLVFKLVNFSIDFSKLENNQYKELKDHMDEVFADVQKWVEE